MTPIPITDEQFREFLQDHTSELTEMFRNFLASRQVKDWEILRRRRKVYEDTDGIHEPDKWCESCNCDIWEVLRIPDGALFTVKERTEQGVIEKFEIEASTIMWARMDHGGLIELGKLNKYVAKDWEIVSFGSHAIKDMTWELKDGRYYNNYGSDFSFNDLMSAEDRGMGNACVADGRMYIKSVRRLPSNEVFTVGEETREGKIERFFIVNGEMCVDTELPFDCDLSELHKLPSKPVLVTTDGIAVYELETVYYVGKKSLEIAHCKASKHLLNVIDSGHYLYFSTREAAEKYVKENRPVYSETMIWKALQASFIGSAYIKDIFSNLEKTEAMTAYIPISIEKELPKENTFYLCVVKPTKWQLSEIGEAFFFNGRFMQARDERAVTHWLKPTKDAIVMTKEEFRGALETAWNDGYLTMAGVAVKHADGVTIQKQADYVEAEFNKFFKNL